MQPVAVARHPVSDRAAANVLGQALRRAGYSEDAVLDLLGDEAYSGERDDLPVFERRLPTTPLASVVRGFFLHQPVPKGDVERALGKRALAALEATALAEVGDDVVPRGRILPVGKLLIASDDYPPGEEPPDYVAAYTPTSQICESLTPRRRVARAVDVGTGSGVQALFAAQHARQVVATDVNPRALAYTELNAALNGVTNVECREGSLFEPVAGEKFDLITSNAPYVVSPERRWAYRDAGLEADEFSAQLIRMAAAHLAEGGFATMMLSWVAADETAPDEHALDWTSNLGCDSWILPVWGSDPLDHAATWNDDIAGDRKAFGAALDEWTGYLARLGVRWVTEGAIVLHRRPGRRHSARVDEVDEDTLGVAGDQVWRAFAARARLADLPKRGDLLDARLLAAARLQLEQDVGPSRGRDSGGARIHLATGTKSTVEVTPGALDVVAALDGRATVGALVRRTAKRRRLSRAETEKLSREALWACRELLELGALDFGRG
jgi:methylase of polypeptide subunit release factors